jgi:CheY-like chemotaxis protein
MQSSCTGHTDPDARLICLHRSISDAFGKSVTCIKSIKTWEKYSARRESLHAVVDARDGAEALWAVSEHHPELITTDYQMPVDVSKACARYPAPFVKNVKISLTIGNHSLWGVFFISLVNLYNYHQPKDCTSSTSRSSAPPTSRLRLPCDALVFGVVLGGGNGV